jgi:hypothetical protein
MGSSKTSSKTIKRYRINPLELVIFTLVTAGFGFSVYHLFGETGGIEFATLQPMTTQPTQRVPGQGGSRAIATISGAVDGVAPMPNRIDFEVNCAENPGFQFGNQVCPTEPNKNRVFHDSSKFNPSKLR